MVVGTWYASGIDPDIYIDISEEDDPVKPAITLEIYNGSDADLYIKLVPEGPETWTFTPKELGLVPAGEKKTFYIEDWGQRPLPGEELTELITLKLEAYLDSGYSEYVGAVTKDLYVHFIDMSGYNVIDDDDFTEDTEGWSGGVLSSTHYVTPPNSLLKSDTLWDATTYSACSTDAATPLVNKTFTIPDVPKAFLSLYARVEHDELPANAELTKAVVQVYVNDTLVAEVPALDRWVKIVTPIPTNMDVTVKVKGWLIVHFTASTSPSVSGQGRLYVDHVRVRYP